MTHSTLNHGITSSLRHFIDDLQYPAIKRRLALIGGNCWTELNAHLRHDIGEDDCHPASEPSLLQLEAARASSVDQKLLRSF
jgi:hypothetical protein